MGRGGGESGGFGGRECKVDKVAATGSEEGLVAEVGRGDRGEW